MLGWLFSKATGGVIEAVGTAVNKNIRTLKGDKAEVEGAIHDEQMAVLAEHAAEMAVRPDRTTLDAIIDFLNRLPRVIITFWIFAIMTWPAIDAKSFIEYVSSMALIPDELWQIAMVVLSLYFGGRIIASDIKKPKLSVEQKKRAIEVIERQQEKVIEASRPLIVTEAPTRKPAPPPWAVEHDPLAKPAPPPIKTDPSLAAPIVKGRPPEVEAMIRDMIRREAGYVNDPSDSGGPTCWGITQNTLSAWREKECSIDDVRALTEEEAFDIYLKEFYFGPSIDGLPMGLQAHILDISCNSGPRRAVLMLQEALNQLGAGLKEDGIIGPMTREACNSYDLAKINNTLKDIRKAFYCRLAERDPKNQRFLKGWLIRADLFAA